MIGWHFYVVADPRSIAARERVGNRIDDVCGRTGVARRLLRGCDGAFVWREAYPCVVQRAERALAAAIATRGFNVHLAGESRRVIAQFEAFQRCV